MKRKTAKNRWVIAASAVGIHLAIGSVYAWSVYTKPITLQMGWELEDTQLTFSIAIFFLGLSAAFLGHFLEKYGPRRAGILAAVLFGTGVAGSGLAIELESVYLLYLFYGVFGGIGLGLGYITPVATLLKWFPDKPGLAAGLAIMGFGFAALISSPLIVYLIAHTGIAFTFYSTGAAYFIIILASSLYLAPPPQNWSPTGFKEAVASGKKKLVTALANVTASKAIRTKRFWYLWVMFFINITCGIAIISVASPMAQEYTSLSPVAAATMVGVMGLFNGAGRIGWAGLSDLTGRPGMFSIFFIIQIAAYLMLPAVSNELLFQLLLFLIISCYGGGFATMPAFIGDIFGTKQLGIIFGYILTAWAAAGMAGPLFAAKVRSITNSYDGTLYLFAFLLLVALGISGLMFREVNRLRAEKEKETLPTSAEKA